ncbi:MAG: protein phosphatase 2C domain-containing protein [Planctomycetia bacterium]|nr:protein phosphatase 2C domain-containing protein [Planctomycetia bacterium]
MKIATNTATFSLPNLRIRAGVTSSQGKRRDCNEDSAFVSPELDVFIIADGMGGHDAGEVASRFAVDALAHALAHLPDKVHSDEEVEALLRSSLQEAHCLVAPPDAGKGRNHLASGGQNSSLAKPPVFGVGDG